MNRLQNSPEAKLIRHSQERVSRFEQPRDSSASPVKDFEDEGPVTKSRIERLNERVDRSTDSRRSAGSKPLKVRKTGRVSDAMHFHDSNGAMFLFYSDKPRQLTTQKIDFTPKPDFLLKQKKDTSKESLASAGRLLQPSKSTGNLFSSVLIDKPTAQSANVTPFAMRARLNSALVTPNKSASMVGLMTPVPFQLKSRSTTPLPMEIVQRRSNTTDAVPATQQVAAPIKPVSSAASSKCSRVTYGSVPSEGMDTGRQPEPHPTGASMARVVNRVAFIVGVLPRNFLQSHNG